MQDWHYNHTFGAITLHGANAGPNRGIVYYNGSPLCDDGEPATGLWDTYDATVVCKMLGFTRATASYRDSAMYLQ